jgi:hypothetical protein
MPDHAAPLPAGVPRGKRIGPDLINIVTPPWLAVDDRTGTVEGVGVVDAFTALRDSEHGCFDLVDGAEADWA